MNTPTDNSIQDIYPLSPTQQGMLFHSLMERNSGVYVVQVGFTLRGPLDESKFIAAWQHLVQRHDVLRTAFVWEKLESPLQVVGKKVALPFETLDWQETFQTPIKYEAKLSEWLAADRRRGFEPTAAPLMRVTLIQLAPELVRVVWTYHHLLLDGWSLPLLLREWVAAYQAEGQTTPQRSELPYRDYIAWLQQQDNGAANKFWQEQLSGLQAPTPLGIDHRNNTQTGVGTASAFLPTDLTQRLKEIARRERLTLSTLVQGAWAAVLARYSDQTEVVFGLARSGRPPTLPKFDQRVGMFINTLPMRIKLNDDQDVIAWLRTIQSQQQAQQPYEYATLTEIHAASDFPRNLPLFESVVVFENYPMNSEAELSNDSLLLEEVAVQEQTNYPLNLFAVAHEQLELRILYAEDRFQATAIVRLLGHLQSVLIKLDLLSDDETKITVGQLFPILGQCLEYVGEYKKLDELQCVHTAIATQASARADKIAVICNDETLDYATLDRRANQLACYFHQQGLTPGSTVGILLHRSMDMIVTLLAVLKAGCKYVPLDPTHPSARLKYIIDDAQLNLIVCQTETLSLVDATTTLKLDLKETRDEITALDDKPLDISTTLTDTAYLIYTSGSTGQPKGVPITHASLANLLYSMAQRIDFGINNRLLAVTTLAFDIAALELLLPLSCGGCVVITDDDTTHDGEKILAAIGQFQIDTMQATPATWQLIAAKLPDLLQGQNNDRFTILCGGEAIDIELARQLLRSSAEVWNVYGPTETTIWSGALQLTETMLANQTVPIGGPLTNTSFCVLDSQDRPVPLGVAGELCIGGAGLSTGYHQRDELTQDNFFDSTIASATHQRLYRTGDKVRGREDKLFDFLGRLDNQTKLRGYRIELGEIEAALQTHDAIEQAIVVVQHQGSPEARLLAVVRMSPEHQEISTDFTVELRAALSERLPVYMLPAAYHPVDRYPLTPNGKVDRQALTQIKVQSKSSGGPPRTQLERELAEIWQSLLQINNIGIHDNFFDMGGHSLLIMKAQSQLREQLNVDLPLVEFFRHPTLSTLATHILEKQQTTAKNSLPAQDRSTKIQAGKARLQQRLRTRGK